MDQRLKKIHNDILNKKHYSLRQDIELRLADEFRQRGLSDMQRAVERLKTVLKSEKPVILDGERIVYFRTLKKIPEIHTKDEMGSIRKSHFVWQVNNLCSDYETTIKIGLEGRRKEVLASLTKCEAENDAKGMEFLRGILEIIDSIEALADRYRQEAEKMGNHEVAALLKNIPKKGAATFREALQFFRILHFTLWASKVGHNTVGCFDRYMYTYLKADLDSGRLDYDGAYELLEEFFISFNKDSDLYPGVQQGDNGQSIVLGGSDEAGVPVYNLLSEMCLKASLDLKLIDPKINLRVDKNTPIELFELGTRLTKQGLGFPQYSNDDIVIPGLVQKGYALNDARNYAIAACWEFIIPGCAMDIPNIDALSFPKVVDICLHQYLKDAKDFDSFMLEIRKTIQNETDAILQSVANLYMEPAPFQSLLMTDCIARARDISEGAKYNNYGIHGTGIATAADSLATIKKFIFEEKTIRVADLIIAIDRNFEGFEDMREKLRYDAPKMGNNDDYVDGIAVAIMDMFADALEGKKNERGGYIRPGSGSAMYYLWHSKDLGASPDGRKKGEPLSANFSPALNARVKGPVSIIRSFTKPDMRRIINGGPLTLELHDMVFRNEESLKKVALLVKTFIDLGGQQIQLNSVNRDTLLEAQKNPELHKNLIVRVWGWSGYFVDLDKEYQDHIISRVELAM